MPFDYSPESAQLGNWEFSSRSVPYRENVESGVSGDAVFLETERIDGGWMVLLIDVSGKGESAQNIVDLLAETFLADSRAYNQSANSLMTLLNSWLAPVWAETFKFVCGTFLQLTTDNETARLSVAAMPPPWMADGENWFVPEVSATLPLGAANASSANSNLGEPNSGTAANVPMPTGAAILIASDGITDAVSGFGQRSTDEAMAELLAAVDVNANPLIDEIWNAAIEIAGDDWLGDDTTLVVVRRV